jgi:hypothetical protein
MANPEHLQVLKQGIEAWNQWLDGHRNLRPALAGASLYEVKLGRATPDQDHPQRDQPLASPSATSQLLRESPFYWPRLPGSTPANVRKSTMWKSPVT